MIYLNLLPPKEKKEFRFLSVNKILDYYLFVLFSGLVFFALVFFGAKYFLIYNSNVFKAAIEERMSGEIEQSIDEMEEKIKEINRLIGITSDINENKTDFFGILRELSVIRPDGIFFNSITHDLAADDGKKPYKFSIEGFAAKREEFLDFLDKIEASHYFEDVNSPLSNLVKKEDFDFRITFNLE